MTIKRLHPEQDPERLLFLQLTLIDVAERLLGERDRSFELRPPVFVENGPFIRVWNNPRAARSELSNNAKVFWPTAVFELAHETVHLMNPIGGHTNYLEEGVAVAFQLHVAPALSGVEIPIELETYLRAHELVLQLGEPALSVAAKIRKHFGKLSSVTPTQLAELFPQATEALLAEITNECIGR